MRLSNSKILEHFLKPFEKDILRQIKEVLLWKPLKLLNFQVFIQLF